ncbi:MAG: TetR/AcrR family transcriptional regulator [Rhizomicrobium sp.]
MVSSSPIDASRAERRARSREFTRTAILAAARQVAVREGAANLSLRAVAAEAGFAPAALYGYFANKNELLIALAAEDLGAVVRGLRELRGEVPALGRAAGVVVDLLRHSETMAAGAAALPSAGGTADAERLFNGRLIAALRALSEACGTPDDSRQDQADVVLIAAALTGVAVLARSGRLQALGFSPAELIGALDRHFAAGRAPVKAS